MNFRPTQDRILVKRMEPKETTKGGIIIPDAAKEKAQEGEVVAVGPGKMKDNGDRIPMDIKQGDRVLFGRYSGTTATFDSETVLFMREDEILGVVNDTSQ